MRGLRATWVAVGIASFAAGVAGVARAGDDVDATIAAVRAKLQKLQETKPADAASDSSAKPGPAKDAKSAVKDSADNPAAAPDAKNAAHGETPDAAPTAAKSAPTAIKAQATAKKKAHAANTAVPSAKAAAAPAATKTPVTAKAAADSTAAAVGASAATPRGAAAASGAKPATDPSTKAPDGAAGATATAAGAAATTAAAAKPAEPAASAKPTDPAAPPPAKDGEAPEDPPAQLTGDWGGQRARLAAAGLELSLVYRYEVAKVLSGASDRKPDVLGMGDLRLNVDLEKLADLHGLSAVLDILGTHGANPSAKVADEQGTSNIEAPANTLKVYEAYLQTSGAGGNLSILAGLHDLNSEFYVTDAASVFRNSSFGVGRELSQTGANGPSIYPETAPAVRIKMSADPSVYTEIGVFAAMAGDPGNPRGTHARIRDSDGLLAIAETAYLAKPSATKLAIGLWGYTRARDDNQPQSAADTGAYLSAERTVANGVTLFIRHGRADSPTERVALCTAGGIVLSDFIPGHLGLGLTSAAPHTGSTERAETAYELVYKIDLVPGLALQPDIQVIAHPDGDSARKNVQTAAIRIEVSL